MNSHISKKLAVIFLMSIICCHVGTGAVFGEHSLDTVREKTKRAYQLTRKKTRTLYKQIKKHKRLAAAVIAYLIFEGFGYYHSWDTPLRRLLTPKKLLDDVIQAHAAQIAQLTNDNQQAYKELERRCQKKLTEKEAIEFERLQKSLLEQIEKFEASNSW